MECLFLQALHKFVNSSLGYLAWPDDGLIRVKGPKHIVIHLTVYSITLLLF